MFTTLEWKRSTNKPQTHYTNSVYGNRIEKTTGCRHNSLTTFVG